MTSGEKKYKLFKFWTPVVVWALVIFTFSSQPSTRASQIHWQDFIIKKSAHMFVFGNLAFLIYRALVNTTDARRKSAAYIAILCAIIYGFSDEFHQMFTPGREPTLRDVGFDTLGALLALSAVWYILPKASKRIQNWGEILEVTSPVHKK